LPKSGTARRKSDAEVRGSAPGGSPSRAGIASAWEAVWPEALAAWGFYVRLRTPFIAMSSEDASKEGLRGSFAMIRLGDHVVVIDAEAVERCGLGDYGREILAHEAGHHVYCPANLEDAARMSLRVRKALYTMKAYAPMIGNLWTDLLINDRLKRESGFRMEEVYERIGSDGEDALWRFYLRTYEILWSLMKGRLAKGEIDDGIEADARLAAGLARSWRTEWWRGAGRFAAICLPYLLKDQELRDAAKGRIRLVLDATAPGAGSAGELPAGVLDDDGSEDAVHPALEGLGEKAEDPGGSASNAKIPFEYGEILAELGIEAGADKAAAAYYRAMAAPHLVPFPKITERRMGEPEAEGFSVLDPGDPLDEASWIESVMRSPVLIPGYTILERDYAVDEGRDEGREPLDLDIYIDSSGSMPDPQRELSHLALAGTIMALSALRAGASVQATLWSGPRQWRSTDGFVRNADAILAVVTGCIGGCTAFPIHKLRDTYVDSKPRRRTHVMIISDDGVTTLFDKDERGGSGKEIARKALAAAGGGGSMALNIPPSLVGTEGFYAEAAEMGWDIAPISDWEDLAAYARAFSRKTYGDAAGERRQGAVR